MLEPARTYRRWAVATLMLLALALASAAGCARPASRTAATAPGAGTTASSVTTPPTVFAVIGDFGSGDEHEDAVAKMVASWQPEYIVATGDNYRPEAGGTGLGCYDNSVGKFYAAWLKDVSSAQGIRGTAPRNAFFPVLGNHDYDDAKPAPDTYLAYFTLPGADFTNTSGNERYYDFAEGSVHFYMLDSNQQEPDGTTSDSKQAKWLKAQLAKSDATWDVVIDHHPPYSSDDDHGSTDYMEWPFADWGADVLLSGHGHVYERVMRNGIPYFVNGLGGVIRTGFVDTPTEGSAVRFSDDWGAQKVSVTDTTMTFEFYSVGGKLVDSYTITKAAQ